MLRPDEAGWLAFWTGAGTLFWVGEKRGWPLCGAVRHLFRSHTPEGKALMLGSLATGAIVLGAHLAKQPTD